MTKFYVYEHWRLDRDECFYVGKGCGKRAFDMVQRNQYHKAITAKLGRIGSGVEVRMVATGLDEVAAYNLEKERIEFWKLAGADMANLKAGGAGSPSGKPTSEETRKKLSDALMGRPKAPFSEGHRTKMRANNLGKTMPEETRKKISAGLTGRPCSEETRARLSAKLKGKARTEDQKAKMSSAQKARTYTPEQIEKMTERGRALGFSRKGIPPTEAMLAANKKVADARRGVPIGPHTPEWSAKIAEAIKAHWVIRKAKKLASASIIEEGVK